MKNNIDYSLYLCTDREIMTSATIEESIESAIKGGVTVVQLREKNCSSKEFYELALRVKKITDTYKIPLIINDRLDIALAIKADGIHVGQSDLPCKQVKEIVEESMIIGVSAANLQEALQAQEDGATYIGVGAMFPTETKTDARDVTVEELCQIQKSVTIPIVAIGGMNKQTIPIIKGIGIDGIAVVSAIVAKSDVEKATKELLELWKS